MEHVTFVDKLPVEHADFSQQTVKLPEGTSMSPLFVVIFYDYRL